MVNLEPALAVRASSCGIVDLGKPDGNRALVTGGDGMVWIVGDLGTTDNMTPPCTNTGTSRNIDDVVIFVLEILVASEIWIVDVLDRLRQSAIRIHWSREENHVRYWNLVHEHLLAAPGQHHSRILSERRCQRRGYVRKNERANLEDSMTMSHREEQK